MTTEEIRATLTLCLLASFADGEKHEREREQIRQVAEGLAADQQINLPHLYQDVLLRRVQLSDVLAQLQTTESRQLAYEMALCVCEADGSTSPKEAEFLAQLREAFGSAAQAATASAPATAVAPAAAAAAGLAAAATLATPPAQALAGNLVDAPLNAALPEAPLALTEPAPHPAAADPLVPAQTERRPSTLSVEAMDQKILKSSILNGAIELLPENLSTLAIIPLQMRLVYQIGQNYGYELDKGHIKDLLGALGVGLTSQYLEQAGRKLLGGLLGKAGKGLLGGLGKQAVSSGMSFASTYALGHVANQYYAGGRQLSTEMLKNAYQHVMQDGRQLQSRYQPQMQETARGLNTAKILSMVRGGQ
ncbi:TerB family tellurite resistance protein [Comamonas piscis]|uniref:TerB family tellurite resistance protein n=1 Tax=Comamonas piscis TaxID=1562974 RepID=A0A7G5EFS7_9BURK|nr:TerB family tellurite resistance protein [Comamonas piscis]QMV72852.1 TerB family tellurite resistance protein [Comamonas piscis]WSO35629.1 TerB family tellurite resistance protein [Comamonas piscis]